MIKKNLTSSIILVMMLLITPCVSAQTYRQIKGWSKEVNDRLEDFLNSTITMKIRKVAVFDGDGTVMGQVPHYLADEALYQYADEHFKGKTDKFSKEKMAILNRMGAFFGRTDARRNSRNGICMLPDFLPEQVLSGNETTDCQSQGIWIRGLDFDRFSGIFISEISGRRTRYPGGQYPGGKIGGCRR